MRSSTPCFCFSVTVPTGGEPDLLASRAARVFLAGAGSGVGFCVDPLGTLLVGADRIRAATPFFGGGSCSFCLSVFKCSFQVGGVTFFTYLSWKAWLMLYIFGARATSLAAGVEHMNLDLVAGGVALGHSNQVALLVGVKQPG